MRLTWKEKLALGGGMTGIAIYVVLGMVLQLALYAGALYALYLGICWLQGQV